MSRFAEIRSGRRRSSATRPPWLSRLYWFLERRIDPGTESSQNVYARVVKAHVNRGSRWLDLGCGHDIFPEWITGQQELAERPQLLVGLDYSVESLRQHKTIRKLLAGDVDRLPFVSGTFDLITANMVFEHLANPAASLTEIRRALKPGGRLIFHTTNFWFFQIYAASLMPDRIKRLLARISEGRAESDVFPTLYRINTAKTIERVVADAGFEVEQFQKLNTSSTGDMLLYGPFVMLPLVWRRLLRFPRLQNYRSNFIVVLRTPEHQYNGRDLTVAEYVSQPRAQTT